MTTLKEILKNKECPCVIGAYIQKMYYDTVGNDAECNFCDSSDLEEDEKPAMYFDMDGNPVSIDINIKITKEIKK